MADAERVSVTVEDGVADVRLAWPDRMNALDPAMVAALGATIDALAVRRDVRCVVLSGEGRAFCAGLDLASMAAGVPDLLGGERNADGAIPPQHVAWGWRALPMPVIAAVHGVAFGGGLQIAAGADVRLAAPATRFAIRELHWGLVPDMAGFSLWRGTVRDDVLRELVYTAREFDAAEAMAFGIVTRLADDPHREALALARAIAARSPAAVRAAKRLLGAAPDVDARAMLAAETAEQARLIGGPAMREAVRAAAEGRPPVFDD